MKFIFSIIVSLLFVFSGGQVLSQNQWSYISPMPGSKWINQEQSIAFRGEEAVDPASLNSKLIELNGEISGPIACRVQLANDGKTIIFNPEKPFALGDKVQVVLHSGIRTLHGNVLAGTSFSFTTKPMDNLNLLAKYYMDQEQQTIPFVQESPMIKSNEKSTNQLITYGDYSLPERYMSPTITTNLAPAPGYTFATPRPRGDAPYDQYNVILDKYGDPLFFREWGLVSNLFQKTYNDRLIFCSFSNPNPSLNRWYVLDNHYDFVDTLTMGNGYNIDQHGIAMLENGNHLLIAYDPQPVGMDTVFPGGNPNATVIGLIIQELDPDHNVLFQWRSWDHFDILDGTHIDFTSAQIDYVHGNSIALTNDNQILISCRGMDEVTKIDRNTGEVIWRFGLHAINNMFTFTNDTIGFSKQHDARQLENGNITVYDNGNFHTPQFSQGVEYQLDVTNYTATLVWNYVHDPAIFGTATGSNHRLENGNSLICWGLKWPEAFVEVDQDNNIQWELNYPDSIWNYQAFRDNWATGLFTTSLDTIDYGYYDDYIPWPMIVVVTNNADHEITINSATNHSPAFTLQTQLPFSLQAGETKNIIISFFPDGLGVQEFEDVLTLNYDSYFSDTLSQRVARQIVLKGSTVEPQAVGDINNSRVTVFPNPTYGKVYVSSPESVIEEVSLCNVLGEVMLKMDTRESAIQVDMNGLANGVYFLQLKFANTEVTTVKKLIKR